MPDPMQAQPQRLAEIGVEALGAGMSDWDLRTGHVHLTVRQEQLFGLAPGEFDGRWESFRARVSPDDLTRFDAELDLARSGGEARLVCQYRIRRIDDEERWIESVYRFVRQPDGELARIVGIHIDITDRQLETLRRQRHADELAHRLKNSLSVAQAIARRSLRANGAPKAAISDLEDRLAALAAAHDVLTQRVWRSAPITRIVQQAVERLDGGDARILTDGPEVELPPRVAVALSLALHELGTNAFKHGALSTDAGRVEIRWLMTRGQLRLTWREIDGPSVQAPGRRGFGSDLLERGLADELSGAVRLEYRTDGLVCEIDCRLTDQAERAEG